MASSELIIDDDYCKAIGNYFAAQGERLDSLVAEYEAILQNVESKAIVSGDVSRALAVYIGYVNKLKQQFGNISSVVSKQISFFVSEIDEADEYLF